MNDEIICIDKLRSAKLKITPQRVAILKFLLNTKSHPNIDTIYNQVKRQFPTISIATVYNTIETLKDKKSIIVLNFDEGFMRYDANMSEHGHLFCSKCKNVFDVYDIVDDFKNIISSNENNIYKKYKIDNINIYFTGLCHKCKIKFG